ncbi:MAG: preprotein translocase subunit SecG [Bacilli bacterium]|nr:preprotein translocase subunit SecG [Bacilli bacterium]
MLDILLMVICAVIIILTLLQSGKSDGISSAFTGGEGLNLFANVKERGAEKILSRITLVCGILFFILVVVIRMK